MLDNVGVCCLYLWTLDSRLGLPFVVADTRAHCFDRFSVESHTPTHQTLASR
jgi:hypothetical protein